MPRDCANTLGTLPQISGLAQCRSISESLDRVGWIKRSGSTVYGRNQVDPSPCFLVHPANEALIERHCGLALHQQAKTFLVGALGRFRIVELFMQFRKRLVAARAGA